MDPLKTAWQNAGTDSTKSAADIKEMLRGNKHPVLKKIRTQMIVELVGFCIFGLVYYDFFDGDQKPLYANVILVASLLLVIFHNLAGYLNAARSVKGNNLRVSLEKYERGLKTFAFISILSRVCYTAGLTIFFTSLVDLRLWSLLILLALLAVQVAVLIRMWLNRIGRLHVALEILKKGE